MSGKTDKIKGRIKEAAGALTGNDALREEGKIDQAVGEAKQVVEKVADKVSKAAEQVVKKYPIEQFIEARLKKRERL